MKSRLLGVLCACLFIFVATSTNANLVSRLGGQAVYDTDFDITWIADANLAASNTFGTAGINVSGAMNWTKVNTWIGNLNAANYLGFNDWSLPVTPQPDATCSSQTGGVPPQDVGSGCTGSDMGHLFNVEGVSAATPGLFSNVQSVVYWSGTEFAPDPNRRVELQLLQRPPGRQQQAQQRLRVGCSPGRCQRCASTRSSVVVRQWFVGSARFGKTQALTLDHLVI